MTIFGPDLSNFENGLTLQAGTPYVAAKATEGTGFDDVSYGNFRAQAKSIGAVFSAYHFLHAGNLGAQAAHAHAVVGSTPLMLDWESTAGSMPALADAAGFVDAYRALGGRVWSVYLPHWYWAQLGSPSLSPIAARGLALISSNYSTGGYSESGPGWAAYGGMSPSLWQYTDRQSYGGQLVDFNAYRGSVAQLAALVNGTQPPATPKDDDMILTTHSGSPDVYRLHGDVYGHVLDPASEQGYIAAGVQVAHITDAEHAQVLADCAAARSSVTVPVTVTVDAAQLAAAVVAAFSDPGLLAKLGAAIAHAEAVQEHNDTPAA